MKEKTTLTPAEADAVLDEIERRKAALSSALAGVGLELERAETELGERVLDGHETAVRDVQELRARTDGLNAALIALEKRKAAAVADQKAATAADFRRQAEAKRGELASLDSGISRLLGELSALENVRFTASILSCQRNGGWLKVRDGVEI